MRTFFWCCFISLIPAAYCQAEDVTIYMMEVPPITIQASDRLGMMGDIVAEAFKRAGFQPKFLVVPSPRALAQVPSMINTFIIPLARIPDRESQYTWVAAVMKVERAFFAIDRTVQTFEEARQAFRTIAVSRGTAGYNILLEKGFSKQQIVEVNQGITAPKMLFGGRVDAWYNPVLESRWLLSELPNKTPQRSPPLGITDQYLACSRVCKPEVVERLAETLKAMEADGTVKKLKSLYGYDD